MVDIEKIERDLRDGLASVTGGPFDTPWRHYKTMIFAKDFNGGDSRVADIRGWGYLTGKGHGALGLDPKDAAKISDALGDFIALCGPENICALLDELSRLREVEAKAVEVMRPFAEACPQIFNDWCPDETPAWWIDGEQPGDENQSPVSVGDFRAARAFLSEREKRNGNG